MMNLRKSQFSIVETIFVILLFLSVIGTYTLYNNNYNSKDYSISLESAIDSIYYSLDYRELFINENIEISAITEDWSFLNNTLSNMFNKYELILLDESQTISKTIFSCEEVNGKMYTERIISINSGNQFNFRIVRLGVCY